MTDTDTFVDDAENPSPEAEAPPEPKQLMPEEDVKKSALRESAALVPVGSHGAAPINLAQQVDLAQFMAKGEAGIPPHLRGNPADCLAIIQMADAVGLHPFLLAQKAYVQGGRLAFESQAFHAMLIQSGKLARALRCKYEGEGDDLTCTVWGTLRGESEPHYYTSPRLADVRPPVNASGQVKGSPLWTKKPKVQLWYDTTRDWVRMFAPTACLGMYAVEESEETPIRTISGEPIASGLAERLKVVSRPDNEEGHRDGHAERELDKIAPAAKGRQEILPPKTEAKTEPERVISGKARKKATEAQGEERRENPAPEAAEAAGNAPEAKSGAAGATARPEYKISADAEVLKAAKRTWQQYRGEWLKKIKAATSPDLIKEWKAERPVREQLEMPTEAIGEVRELVDQAVAKLRAKKK